MTFSQVQGNEETKTALAGMADSGRVPHAILFHEDDGGGAFPLCLAFLQYLYCRSHSGEDSCGECPSCGKIAKLIHPDVHFIFPTASKALSDQYIEQFRRLVVSNPLFKESDFNAALGIDGKISMIAVSEAKHLLDELSLSALEGGYRSVVIYLPEMLNEDAANKLLKIIEEPPQKTQFLLIAHRPEKVLATIASRCLRIRVRPSVTAEPATFQDPKLWTDLMDALISRDFLSAIEAGERISALPSRESAKAFCKFASEDLRRIFLVKQGLADKSQTSAEVVRWSAACRNTFPRKALEALDRARLLIGRNVNLKILFTDMVDRLYILI